MTLATTSLLKCKRVTVVTVRCTGCSVRRDIKQRDPELFGNPWCKKCHCVMLPVKAVLK